MSAQAAQKSKWGIRYQPAYSKSGDPKLGLSLLPAQDTDYTFRSKTEIVLVNVTVRDKNGNFVRDLKPEDFSLLEDNKPQKVASFDIENTGPLSRRMLPKSRF